MLERSQGIRMHASGRGSGNPGQPPGLTVCRTEVRWCWGRSRWRREKVTSAGGSGSPRRLAAQLAPVLRPPDLACWLRPPKQDDGWVSG